MGSAPEFITLGSDGPLWFTELLAAQAGRISTSGSITELSLGNGPVAASIATGSDGGLWLNFSNQNYSLGKLTTNGTLTIFSAPELGFLAAGPDGGIWGTYGTQPPSVSSIIRVPAARPESWHYGQYAEYQFRSGLGGADHLEHLIQHDWLI